MVMVDRNFGIDERALNHATLRHEGQVRKFNNEPYINHPKRVASNFVDPKTKAAAYLHDVLEDTAATEEELREFFPDYVVDTVKILTKKSGENYFDFIMRVKNDSNLDAIMIKLADISDNLRDLQEGSLKDKYRLAQYILQQQLVTCQTFKVLK